MEVERERDRERERERERVRQTDRQRQSEKRERHSLLAGRGPDFVRISVENESQTGPHNFQIRSNNATCYY